MYKKKCIKSITDQSFSKYMHFTGAIWLERERERERERDKGE
jgi:hypothetical protein